MNDELVHAIGGKHLVEFVYKAGHTRIVEPHDYGIRRDVERLLGFQIGGESQSGASHGWKEFDVDQIRYLRASWTVGSLVHGLIAPSIIAGGTRSSPV